MNRRSFLKRAVALGAAIALPIKTLSPHVIDTTGGAFTITLPEPIVPLEVDLIRYGKFGGTKTFAASGTWTVPEGVTSFTVYGRGGGGAGSGLSKKMLATIRVPSRQKIKLS